MLLGGWATHIVDVKGAFQKGQFENGEKIYMKITEGMENHYSSTSALLLKKTLYGLRQAAMQSWRLLLEIMKKMGHERSKVDPCIYYSRRKNGDMTIILSWDDDNIIMGPDNVVNEERIKIGKLIDIDDVGPLNKFVGCKVEINRIAKTAKLMQPVMIQSFQDEFDTGKTKRVTPGEAGIVLQKARAEQEQLDEKDQTKYRSGAGKMMHMIRWARPHINNAVRDCARHMQGATEDHYQAMLRVMDYVISMPERGLFLAPKGDWDGKNLDFEFEISGMSDPDYAKYKDLSKSISGCVTYLNGAPITYQSSTQKTVSLLVKEAEMNAAVTLVQDMSFVYKIIKSLGLKVRLPMKVAVDNSRTVFLANR